MRGEDGQHAQKLAEEEYKLRLGKKQNRKKIMEDAVIDLQKIKHVEKMSAQVFSIFDVEFCC